VRPRAHGPTQGVIGEENEYDDAKENNGNSNNISLGNIAARPETAGKLLQQL
jgi:hypothetical protein